MRRRHGGRWRRLRERLAGDAGSMLPMILMAFVVAATLIAATTTASSAFLAQRDLQSVCDGAALAGAQALNFSDLSGVRGAATEFLPVDAVTRAVSGYVADHNTGAGTPVSARTTLSGDLTVQTTCHSHPRLALGAMFGYGSGIDRTAHASARAALDVVG